MKLSYGIFKEVSFFEAYNPSSISCMLYYSNVCLEYGQQMTKQETALPSQEGRIK
jgi:hypothetical protein